MALKFGLIAALALGLCAAAEARDPAPPVPSLDGFSDAIHHWRNTHGDDYPTYAPGQVREIAHALLLLQRNNGGWIENRDPTRILSTEEREALVREKAEAAYSFDNRNIYTQVAYLMGAYEYANDARYRDAARRGLDLILAAQMQNCGGWPHTVPKRSVYHDRLTFADDVTSGNLRLLRRIASREAPFADIGEDRRARAAAALARGDECILRLQVRQNGRRTGWAGQYDPQTLAPAGGRSFELPAIVSQETVGVVRYLMSIPDPSPEQIEAVDSAIAWLRSVQINGKRIETVRLAEPVRYDHHTATTDRRLIDDPNAPPLWARFYDLADNSVVLANRDGVRAATYADIHPERRTGYSWYGDWPADLIARDYPAWRARLGRPPQ